jgi:hypothetical protein
LKGHLVDEDCNMPELIIAPAFFFMVAFIIWTIFSSLHRRHRLRMLVEFNGRLIDRLGSVSDFGEFAKTEAGTKFLNSVMADAPLAQPSERILRAIQMGIVLVLLGLGLLSLGWYFQGNDAQEPFIVTGVIALSIGIGFLLSSAASYRVSASLGLLRTDSK